MPLNAANKEVVRLGPGMSTRLRFRNGRAIPMNLTARNLAFSGAAATFKLQSGAPRNEVQQLVITGTTTSGTFTITWNGRTTDPITYSSTAGTLLANVQAAIAALAVAFGYAANPWTVGVSSVGANSATIQIVFGGLLGQKDQPVVTCSVAGLSGGSPAVAITTPRTGQDFTNCTLSDITHDGGSSASISVAPRGIVSKSFGTDSDSTQVIGPVLGITHTGTAGDLDIELSFADDQVDIIRLAL